MDGKKNKRQHKDDESSNETVKKQKIFQYGNYNRYYGYRNANNEKDKRINVFERSWFENKSCLDIGCNVGHMTLWLSKHFNVKTMKGIDIDCNLIQAAKSNILHYLDIEKEKEKEQKQETENETEKGQETEKRREQKKGTETEQKTEINEYQAEKKQKQNLKLTSTENENGCKDETRFPYNVNFVTVSIFSLNYYLFNL